MMRTFFWNDPRLGKAGGKSMEGGEESNCAGNDKRAFCRQTTTSLREPPFAGPGPLLWHIFGRQRCEENNLLVYVLSRAAGLDATDTNRPTRTMIFSLDPHRPRPPESSLGGLRIWSLVEIRIVDWPGPHSARRHEGSRESEVAPGTPSCQGRPKRWRTKKRMAVACLARAATHLIMQFSYINKLGCLQQRPLYTSFIFVFFTFFSKKNSSLYIIPLQQRLLNHVLYT
jgi:hypothetical protein